MPYVHPAMHLCIHPGQQRNPERGSHWVVYLPRPQHACAHMCLGAGPTFHHPSTHQPTCPTRPFQRSSTGYQVVYEAYGAGGSGFIIDCLTDNANRSATEVRTAVMRGGGKMADPGSVAFSFRRCGIVAIAAGASEEQVWQPSVPWNGAYQLYIYGRPYGPRLGRLLRRPLLKSQNSGIEEICSCCLCQRSCYVRIYSPRERLCVLVHA